MNKEKISQLEKLLGEKKIPEARTLLKELLEQKMTPEERGESLVNMATMYIDIMNSLDGQYEAALKEAVAGLRDLDKQEMKQRDDDKLKKVRESLQ